MYITLVSNHNTFPFTSSFTLKTTPEANPIWNSIRCFYGRQPKGVRFPSRGSPIAAAVLLIATLFRQTFYQVVLTKNVFHVKSFRLSEAVLKYLLVAHALVQSKISTIEIKMCRLILRSQLSSILYNIAPCKPIQ